MTRCAGASSTPSSSPGPSTSRTARSRLASVKSTASPPTICQRTSGLAAWNPASAGPATGRRTRAARRSCRSCSTARPASPGPFLELEEPFAQRIEPGLALLGQLEALRGAPEQHHAEHVLERADLLADGGGRHRQLVGRAGERQVPRGGIEHAQGVERQVGALHDKRRFIARGPARQARGDADADRLQRTNLPPAGAD